MFSVKRGKFYKTPRTFPPKVFSSLKASESFRFGGYVLQNSEKLCAKSFSFLKTPSTFLQSEKISTKLREVVRQKFCVLKNAQSMSDLADMFSAFLRTWALILGYSKI
jgi:hypothetical protein